jgi:hypothetical protein
MMPRRFGEFAAPCVKRQKREAGNKTMREPEYYWVLLDGDWQPAQWRARFGGECFEWLVIGEADAAYRDRITKVGPKQEPPTDI